MKKIRGTIKTQRPISGNPKSNGDYNFVFSSDIRDWQTSKKKKAHTEAYQEVKAKTKLSKIANT